MLLTVRNRQKYLKALGFYDGEIDGKAGPKTKAAYKALQEKYFTRKKDIDGIYGSNTDKLLRNAYNVMVHTKNFRLEEFKCGCGGKYCTGYPQIINTQLLVNLQSLRDKFGAITISSGIRCSQYNARLVGSSSNSRHKQGKAADIKCAVCATESGRKGVMSFWKKLPKYRYTYCNIGGNYPNMGKAVHVDVK